jgi:hypothetical protein
MSRDFWRIFAYEGQMLRSSFALAGLVVVAGCVPTGYNQPVYVNPMPYSQIDPAPFMRQQPQEQPRNATCYPVGMYVNCTAY